MKLYYDIHVEVLQLLVQSGDETLLVQILLVQNVSLDEYDLSVWIAHSSSWALRSYLGAKTCDN